MENLYMQSDYIASAIWAVTTTNVDQQNEICISNEAGDEIYIYCKYASNGINVKLQIFSDGLNLADENLRGGSFDLLRTFLRDVLNVTKKVDVILDSEKQNIMTYSQYIGGDSIQKTLIGSHIPDFLNFLEDLEIAEVLSY